MRVSELMDELRRFNPADEVGVELTPEDFLAMDEDPLCLAVEKVEPGNSASDGCRAKITLGSLT